MRLMIPLAVFMFFVSACVTEPPIEDPTPMAARCNEAAEVACVDDLILDLSLHDDRVTRGQVISALDGDDVQVVVDATAGGFGQEANHPFVYVRLTPQGAERVDIDDETALESMDWDLAFRRFLVRINSGNSGPGCTEAARVSGFEYEQISSEPSGLDFTVDDYYDNTCLLMSDNSGLETPALALASWWSYSSCVACTMTPYVLRLSDGRTIKLRLESYYESGQSNCDDFGTPGTNGGTIGLRYRDLP